MRRRAEQGFTLIELLVALAVFSLVVLALLNLAGENTRTAQLLQSRTLAAMVAENAAIEALISPEPPALGEAEGQVRLGAQDWIWRRITTPADQGLLRIDVQVRGVSEPRTLAEVTVFRGGA
ncbi:type II secretion system minor pseudopilin GspI [Phenylobacterium sp.]|uniref:type II secretion system minor pseudopilin GspI n=1 Tax=Phenylobacterium sp. TaxID=1871053 RepID=UPI00272F3259|nr:type II secretion system minor pseudopilin GspI [Phenylobacterium sp.]MDP1874253.1 type II secretion system minor pseudopilin GspI [Phenylobacterium sp.]MDP3298566.1 type II secretion system minor pseudopilin GspI [Phenylobacterium sp.]